MHKHIKIQKDEESKIAWMLSKYLCIPFNKFNIEREEPDCEFILDNKIIGVEFTSIHPYKDISGTAKTVIENKIRTLFSKALVNNNLHDITIRVILNPNIYFCKCIKNIEPQLSIEINEAINLVLTNPIYMSNTNKYGIESITYNGNLFKAIDITYYKNANWGNSNTIQKKDQLYYTLGGIRVNIPIQSIIHAINEKEKNYNKYMKNREPAFDECWLCIYITKDEDLFTAVGIDLPPNFESKYSRIYIIQESLRFPLVYELKI